MVRKAANLHAASGKVPIDFRKQNIRLYIGVDHRIKERLMEAVEKFGADHGADAERKEEIAKRFPSVFAADLPPHLCHGFPASTSTRKIVEHSLKDYHVMLAYFLMPDGDDDNGVPDLLGFLTLRFDDAMDVTLLCSHGKTSRVGTQLMDHAKAIAVGAGIFSITLKAFKHVVPFYEKQGFTEDEEEKKGTTTVPMKFRFSRRARRSARRERRTRRA